MALMEVPLSVNHAVWLCNQNITLSIQAKGCVGWLVGGWWLVGGGCFFCITIVYSSVLLCSCVLVHLFSCFLVPCLRLFPCVLVCCLLYIHRVEFGSGVAVGHVVVGLHLLFDETHTPLPSATAFTKDVMLHGRKV